MFPLLGDGQRVDLALGRTLNHADALSAFHVPLGYVARGTGGYDLELFSVEYHLFEHCFFEHAAESGVVFQVPNDA